MCLLKSIVKCDIIYLCSPNNPTGAVYTKDGLKKWVDYALKNDAVILFDAAYECFIKSNELPSSIYEIEGAKKCAIEFCSFSKTDFPGWRQVGAWSARQGARPRQPLGAVARHRQS